MIKAGFAGFGTGRLRGSYLRVGGCGYSNAVAFPNYSIQSPITVSSALEITFDLMGMNDLNINEFFWSQYKTIISKVLEQLQMTLRFQE